MLTKVSYNAYASSANGMQRPNQPKNVNFGSKTPTLQQIMKFSSSFLPPHGVENMRSTQYYNHYEAVGRLEVFLEFLGFCQRKPKAKGVEILRGTNQLQYQDTLTFKTKAAGLKAWGEILEFCGEHPDLSAERIHAGAIKEMPLDKMGEHLESERSYIAK